MHHAINAAAKPRSLFEWCGETCLLPCRLPPVLLPSETLTPQAYSDKVLRVITKTQYFPGAESSSGALAKRPDTSTGDINPKMTGDRGSKTD